MTLVIFPLPSSLAKNTESLSAEGDHLVHDPRDLFWDGSFCLRDCFSELNPLSGRKGVFGPVSLPSSLLLRFLRCLCFDGLEGDAAGLPEVCEEGCDSRCSFFVPVVG